MKPAVIHPSSAHHTKQTGERLEIPAEDNRSIEALLDQSYEAMRDHRFQEAQILVNQALDMAPDFSRAWIMDGYLADLQNDTGHALQSYDRAITVDKDAQGWRYKGALLARTGHPEEALLHLDEAKRLDSCDPMTLRLRAIVLAELRRFEEALAEFYQLLSLSPFDTEAPYGLARLYDTLDYAAEEFQDDVQATKWYQRAAEGGHLEALVRMGCRFMQGMGVEVDERQATICFSKAAERGQPYAACRLGLAYHAGIGIPVDYCEARRWYLFAARQGDVLAAKRLGDLHFEGEGVPQNNAVARRWYTRASRGGDERATFQLGYIYLHGLGTPKDLDAARRHYAIAAQAGMCQAEAVLEMLGDPQGESATRH